MFNFLSSGEFNGKVSGSGGDVEPQEIFLDNMSRREELNQGLSEKKFEVPLPKYVLRTFGALIFSIIFILGARSFQMQVIEGKDYQEIAMRNRSIIEPAVILRGAIYDRSGKQLVYNDAAFDVHLNSRFSEEKEVMERLSSILNIERENLEERIEEVPEGGGVLIRNIDHETAIMLKIREDNFPGISVERAIERKYEKGPYLAHILGYTGQVTREDMNKNPNRYTIHDHIGKAGVEKYYEDSLARERGSFQIETDAHGNLISRKEIDPVVPGDNLNLSIDFELQKNIVEITQEVLDEVGSTKASVIALEPDTGRVLAMVSLPYYDNNVFSRTGDKELLNQFLVDRDGVFLNRAIEAEYPTGSVIKPLLAAAGLEEGIITPEKRIHSPGYFDIPNPWNPSNPTRMLDFQAHGWTDMREAIAVSSNVYFYSLGGGADGQEGLGISRIKNYLNLFGWGDRTGIDLPNEKRGVLPDPDWKVENMGANWTPGDTYNASIGQGYLSATPLQVAVSYAALVNGGRVIQPRVVDSVSRNGEEEVFETNVLREDFISPENLKVIKEGMRMTTEIGTARRLGWLNISSGAKTGTAQISKPGHYHNWIAAFAPYEDPEIVLVAMVEEVEGIRASSGTIAFEVFNWYFEQQDN